MLKGLELLKELLNGVEVDDFLEDLFKEPTEEELYQKHYDVCAEMGIEKLVDEDSLRKAVKESIKNGGDVEIDDIPDFEEVCDDNAINNIDITISLADLNLLTGILTSFKPNKIVDKLIKKQVLKDLPGVYMITEIHIKMLLEELEKSKLNLMSKAIKDDPDKKITFKVSK